MYFQGFIKDYGKISFTVKIMWKQCFIYCTNNMIFFRQALIALQVF